jgi:hypothetical protein
MNRLENKVFRNRETSNASWKRGMIKERIKSRTVKNDIKGKRGTKEQRKIKLADEADDQVIRFCTFNLK